MSNKTPVHIVWFKRDLRVRDHAPLTLAAEQGPVLPLYIVEPSIVHAPDFDAAHWTFIYTSLQELRDNLAAMGQPLVVRVGEAVQVLQSIRRQMPIAQLWAHQETGNWLTYQRDVAVHRWAAEQGIPFTELPQHGVVRRLKSRRTWQAEWEQLMRQRLIETPKHLRPVTIPIGRLPSHTQLKLGRDRRQGAQEGGEGQAHATMTLFFGNRVWNYVRGLGDPILSWESCSRLSPHLAFGTISSRTVVQTTRQQIKRLKRKPDPNEPPTITPQQRTNLLRCLQAFESRLHWRDHFMQKLEMEPEIEFRNFLRAMDGVREPHFDQAKFEAWCVGKTGYPLIDASMRALEATGWINFRLRAMLVSFAAYDLWLHWEKPAHHLARLYLDYEPGIHYSQMQMQSGTTGINTIRLYDPTKQAIERDPTGTFIREWVPELASVPELFIHEPWRMPPSVQESVGCKIGQSYPRPIVDHKQAGKRAYDILHRVRQTPAAVAQAQAVLEKHGGRSPQFRRRKKALKKGRYQMTLNLE